MSSRLSGAVRGARSCAPRRPELNERGIATLETAVVLPLLLALVALGTLAAVRIGIAEVGAHRLAAAAAREAARDGSAAMALPDSSGQASSVRIDRSSVAGQPSVVATVETRISPLPLLPQWSWRSTATAVALQESPRCC